jgi:hypothetical protein
MYTVYKATPKAIMKNKLNKDQRLILMGDGTAILYNTNGVLEQSDLQYKKPDSHIVATDEILPWQLQVHPDEMKHIKDNNIKIPFKLLEFNAESEERLDAAVLTHALGYDYNAADGIKREIFVGKYVDTEKGDLIHFQIRTFEGEIPLTSEVTFKLKSFEATLALFNEFYENMDSCNVIDDMFLIRIHND